MVAFHFSFLPTLRVRQYKIVQIIIQKMSEAHNDYLKDDHFEDDEEELHLEPQKDFDLDSFEGPEDQLEHFILDQAITSERKQESISGELQNKLALVLSKIGNQNDEQILKLRMNELALSKILVYTHGKSQFRLVIAHHHIGRAYLNYKCYEQAIDHLTLALKKNSKLGDLKDSKLYHSHVLTTLSRCYYEISSYEDALEVLTRAEDIQTLCFNESNEPEKCNTQTVKLISNCYCKIKDYKRAEQYIEKALSYNVKVYDLKSKEVARLRVEKSKIYGEQKKYQEAINELSAAIDSLHEIKFPNKLELAELEQHIAEYYQKNGQLDKQIESLFSKIELYSQIYDTSHKNTLKLKRSVALLLIKYNKQREAASELEDILETEEKVYGPNSVHVGKTLKMLGTLYMSNEKDSSSAQHYLKRAQKILQDQGNLKLLKEVKSKLVTLKENREKRINVMINQPN